jgi:hypothetical protein
MDLLRLASPQSRELEKTDWLNKRAAHHRAVPCGQRHGKDTTSHPRVVNETYLVNEFGSNCERDGVIAYSRTASSRMANHVELKHVLPIL